MKLDFNEDIITLSRPKISLKIIDNLTNAFSLVTTQVNL